MSAKRFAILKRYACDNGLELIDSGTEGTRWFIVARAVNGQTQKFTLPKREGDLRGDLNESARIKRFAVGNADDVLVGVSSAAGEFPFNPLEAALTGQPPIPVAHKGRRRLTLQLPNGHDSSPVEDVQVKEAITPLATPQEALGGAIPGLPEDPDKGGVRSGMKLNRLTQGEFYRLARAVDGIDTQQYETLEALTVEVAKRVEFKITRYNVREVCLMLGKPTASQSAAAARGQSKPSPNAIALLARTVVGLLEHLGEPVPAEIRKLAK